MSNENIVHIQAIEGLLSEANKHLDRIVPQYPREIVAKAQVLEDIDLLQKTSLYDLRTLCEGD